MCYYHLEEVHPFCMILEGLFGANHNNMEDAQLDELRKDYGGFELAYKILVQKGVLFKV